MGDMSKIGHLDVKIWLLRLGQDEAAQPTGQLFEKQMNFGHFSSDSADSNAPLCMLIDRYTHRSAQKKNA